MIIFIIDLNSDYIYGIIKLKTIIDYYKFTNYRIIINSTYKLNFNFNFEYTKININNLNACIKHLIIDDNDFIVKINGNFILKLNSPFMKCLNKLDKGLISADVISKYYFSDLFGIRAKYLYNIDYNKNFNLELEKAKSNIDEDKQLYLEILGININPNSKSKFTIY